MVWNKGQQERPYEQSSCMRDCTNERGCDRIEGHEPNEAVVLHMLAVWKQCQAGNSTVEIGASLIWT